MKTILITPLDWGLGHATRCIPIVQEFLKRKCKVLLGGSGDSIRLLKNEFPDLQYLELPGYHPVYPSNGSMVTKMALQVPKFLKVINEEHKRIETIIQQHKVDLLISDNRYGCWSQSIPSVFITHQLNILMPKGFGWLQKVVGHFNNKLIKNFTYCWIPDYAEHERSLSGDLSRHHGSCNNTIYVGPLSRFSRIAAVEPMHEEIKFDVTCILSGPEPQRSIFEQILSRQLKDSGLRYFIVSGVFSNEMTASGSVTGVITSGKLRSIILQSATIIARSGYSTIMDLAALGKKAILVPTPGQTEQEYLARRFHHQRFFFTMLQQSFDLQVALRESKKFNGIPSDNESSFKLLGQAIDERLK
jgi:uncharacterized protein (TIGR00661 family)